MLQHERLKSIRSSLKLSQAAMADKLGIKQSYYSALERGEKKISSNVLDTLFNDVGVSADWFYNLNGSMFNNADSGIDSKVIPVSSTFQRMKSAGTIKYIEQFNKDRRKNHPEYNKLANDVFTIIETSELVGALHGTELFKFVYSGMDYLPTVGSFQELKEKWYNDYAVAYKHIDIIHKYASACSEFLKSIRGIQEGIDLDYEFDD